ncbi:MAG: ABC transporter ATP-binding protein [Anaerolineales bacterium]|nr:ABC transporter ATP-binding protein [Anaerolineales bacterium]
MNETLLQVKDLEIKYHTREGILTALRNVSFEIKVGEIVGIVGESGCGKSTVASSVLNLLPTNGEISGGQILFQGRDLRKVDEDGMRHIRGKDMSMIFQDPMTSLNPVFSIEHQMVDALRAHQRGSRPMNRRDARNRVVEMLDRVGIPDARDRIGDYPHQFSGGMRQRIMIAIALLSNPALLVADEPTSALDVTLEAQIIDLIRGLRDEYGTAILYITHDLGLVAQLCDRVLVMYAGNVVESGDVFSIFQKPQHPYTRALLCSHPTHSFQAARLATIRGRVPSLKDLPAGCKFAPRCDLAIEICHTQEPRCATCHCQTVLCHAFHPNWSGASPETLLISPERSAQVAEERDNLFTGEPIVEVKGLKTYFKDRVSFIDRLAGRRAGVVRALDGVDITVHRGETLALVGESGSGKTTFGRTILRLEDSTTGHILVDGQDVTDLSQRQVRPMRARLQMIFQDPMSSLSPRKKVSSLLLEPFIIQKVPVDPGKVDELLEMVGLSSEQADKYAHQLSGGQARRVGIARALALHPDLLVADEPTAGLDVSVAAGILNLLKDLRQSHNLSYIIITHNLNVIRFIADRVAVMYLGQVVELVETQDLFSRPAHPYSEALMSAIAIPDPNLRDKRLRIVLEGEIPSPRTPPPGCPFHPRCRYAEARCTKDVPNLLPLKGQQRLAACHFPERVLGQFTRDD